MDIRPTREKSADEIHRIQASVRRNFDADQPEILLIPTVVPLFTQSAPVLQRKWETLLSYVETIKEAEEDIEVKNSSTFTAKMKEYVNTHFQYLW